MQQLARYQTDTQTHRMTTVPLMHVLRVNDFSVHPSYIQYRRYNPVLSKQLRDFYYRKNLPTIKIYSRTSLYLYEILHQTQVTRPDNVWENEQITIILNISGTHTVCHHNIIISILLLSKCACAHAQKYMQRVLYRIFFSEGEIIACGSNPNQGVRGSASQENFSQLLVMSNQTPT